MEVSRRPADKSDLAKAKEALEGLQLIASRQKLIKMADHSKYSWPVVTNYEATDHLALGSKDERQLGNAGKAIEKKYLKKRKVAARASSQRVAQRRLIGIP